MSKLCVITGKKPLVGNNRSHALNATKRRFLPNLHKRKIWLASEQRFITITTSAKGLRTIDKKGIEATLRDLHIKF